MFCTLLCNFYLVYGQTVKFTSVRFDNPVKKTDFILFLSKNYNSQSYAFLNGRNPEEYIHWARGKSHREILSNYAKVIHETCHLVNDEIGGFFGRGFYIAPDIRIRLIKSSVFKSSEIDKDIPDKWKNQIFRYRTYIQGLDPEDHIASIHEGIYGLLDEFDAYFQSTRAIVELYDYYKTIASYKEPNYWILYLSNCYSSIFAYDEFRLFVAWYLKYAKKNYPKIYQSLLDDKKLRAVYTLIDNAYAKVVQNYFDNRSSIINNINKAGLKKVYLSEKYLFITTKDDKLSRSIGIGIPDAEIKFLKSLFTQKDYEVLQIFRIENLNEQNFQSRFKP